jgi:hypothetical protein
MLYYSNPKIIRDHNLIEKVWLSIASNNNQERENMMIVQEVLKHMF